MINIPSRLTIVDVAARDGLQSFPRWVDTATKIALIDRLSAAGFPVIETTSFAHPKAVPNLADAEAVLAGIKRREGTVYRALVPNARGAARAVNAPAPPDELIGLIVVSESYLAKNQNMTLEKAAVEAIAAFELAEKAGLRFVMALGGAFWDVYEGLIPQDKVLRLIERFYAAGIRSAYLGGSIGMEDPRHVGALFGEITRLWPDLRMGFHVHNLSGSATANVVAAMDAGISFVEGAICGIGGGIAMPSGMPSIGNLASEDIVYLLNEMGVDCGVDTDEAVSTSRDIARLLGIEPVGHLAACGSRREIIDRFRSSAG